MDWQIAIVGLIIVAAAIYLARQSWRTWFAGKGGCGGGCACPGRKATSPPPATLVPPEELTLRRRLPNG